MANGIRTGDPRGFNKFRSSVKVPEFDKHLKKAGGHIGRNVVEITIKMKTIVRKTLMIKKKVYDGFQFSTPEDERIPTEIMQAFDKYCIGGNK